MDISLITQVLGLISAISPATAAAGTVVKIISTLTALVPALTQEANDLTPIVKGIIVDLKGNPATPAEQMDALDVLNKQCDDAFDAAADAALAEDAAAKP